MRRLFIALALITSACASSTSDDVATGQEQHLNECVETDLTSGYGGIRGWDCHVKNSMCTRKCFGADEGSRTYVQIAVDGKTLDSRAVPYQPVVSLDHVLVYGCTLWDFADKTHQGLDFEYKRIIQGAIEADRRSDFEDYVNVSIGSFTGPGKYKADPTYIASDEAQAAGKIYAKADGCDVDVKADAEGGLTGTITCDSIATADGATTSLKGEFACPGTSMSPIFSRLP